VRARCEKEGAASAGSECSCECALPCGAGSVRGGRCGAGAKVATKQCIHLKSVCRAVPPESQTSRKATGEHAK
jgi:hypothetical protein